MVRWDVLAAVLGVVTLVWGSAFFGWRWARGRLGLDATDAPNMGQREKSVRRSLRALLAFNFFVMWPAGLPSCVMVATSMFEDREMLGPSLAAILGMLGFTVAVPALIRTARLLERYRLAGQPDATPPSFWIEGGAALFSRQRTSGVRWMGYAIIAVVLLVGIVNWEMTLAFAFYAAIFGAARLGWIWLTRRKAS